jgi:hypothetical protein
MGDSSVEIVKVVLDKTIGPVMDLLTKIAAPAAEEIGYSLQDRVKFFRAKQRYQVLEKIQRFLSESGIDPQPIPLKVLLPALEYASDEEDENLHTMWAALLANAADPKHGSVLPSFVDTLKQLTKEEALFLKALYEKARMASPNPEPYELLLPELQQIYYDSTHGTIEAMTLVVDDLQRLRLIEKKPNVFTPFDEQQPLLPSVELTRSTVVTSFVTNYYGLRFIEACMPPIP